MKRSLLSLSKWPINGRCLALAVLASLLISTVAIAQETETPIRAVAVTAVDDPGWPREIKTGENLVTIFQPQIETWEDHTNLKGRLALSIKLAGTEEPVYGSILLEAPTTVSVEDRTVILGKRTATKINFPGQEEAEVAKLTAIIKSVATPDKPIVVSLDRVLAGLELTENQEKVIQVNLDPPPIHYSDEPAILVVFLGKPQMESIPGTSLLFGVNTNWDVFLHVGTSQYYLLNGDHWLTSTDPATPWKPAASLPEDFKKLPDVNEWAEVRKYISAPAAASAPKVFYADRPAELIVTAGKPEMGIIAGTKLLDVTNTESDVFLSSDDGNYYFLSAGRWFSSKAIEGPWEAATETLPKDFAAIPGDHEAGAVLASVPGTPEADEAILMASIPKKATVKRSGAKLDVTYDGEPKFMLIEGTDSVEFAQNTSFQVFRVKGSYYCCFEAVWFSATSPTGPWALSGKVPGEIYKIPPSSPHHNVSYVYVYDSSPEDVTVGHTSGYEGSYIVGKTLMFGLGVWAIAELADNHWWGYHHHHAHWFSYGCGVHYNHYTGGWGRGYNHYYGPHGGAGRYATYNHSTGTYRRGAVRYGPGGASFARQAYNPGSGTWGGQVGYRSPYQSWGRGVVTRDDDWVRTGHYRQGNKVVAGFETSKGTAAIGSKTAFGRTVVGEKNGNVFVGKNGDLYRRNETGGSWDKLDKGGFKPVQGMKIDRSTVSSKIASIDRTKAKESITSRTSTIDRTKIQSKITTKKPTISRPTIQPKVTTRTPTRTYTKPSTSYRGTSSKSYGSGLSGQLNRDSYSRQRGSYRSSQSSSRSGSGFSRGSSSRSRSSGGGRRRR